MTARRSTDPLVLALAMGIREIAERRARGELPPPTPLVARPGRIVRADDEREQVPAAEPCVGESRGPRALREAAPS